MNTLDITISCGLNPKKVAGSNGGEYASPCPMCGGEDRFRIWPNQGKDGTTWCRGCEKGGDAIQLLRDAKGMSYPEACRELGHEISERKEKDPPKPPQGKKEWNPRETADPAELWRKKATAFVEYSHKELLGNQEQLAWLVDRGITEASVRKYRLGWNPRKIFRAKKSWGVDDNGKKLYIPIGLVIPFFVEGRLVRVRVRQPEDEPRYLVIQGSGMATWISNPERPGLAVIESELDAILIDQDAGDIVGTIALGNNSARPDVATAAALARATQILNALDFDIAGAKRWIWWEENFKQADRWPVPGGKDPGEYRSSGGDIRGWILDGLPRGLHPDPTPKPEPVPVPVPEQAKATAAELPSVDNDDNIIWIEKELPCPSCGKQIKYVFTELHYKERDRVSCWDCLIKEERKAS